MSCQKSTNSEQRPATFKDLARLTVNRKGQLCLDGKPIEVRRLALSKWQSFFATAAAMAVIVQAIIDVLDRFPQVLRTTAAP